MEEEKEMYIIEYEIQSEEAKTRHMVRMEDYKTEWVIEEFYNIATKLNLKTNIIRIYKEIK